MDKNNIKKIIISNINLIKINIKYPNNISYKRIAMDILKESINEYTKNNKLNLDR
jgi:hypothetical protein